MVRKNGQRGMERKGKNPDDDGQYKVIDIEIQIHQGTPARRVTSDSLPSLTTNKSHVLYLTVDLIYE